jgi:hypothetical protein
LTISGLNLVSSCGLDPYTDTGIVFISAFTLTFTMQVSVLSIMADKSMRPDAGNGTLLGVTAASNSKFNHGIYIEQSE